MRIALLAGSSVLPALVLLWIFYKRDMNREPRSILLKTFLRGMLAVIPVLIVATGPLLLIQGAVTNPLLAGALIAFACAALPEEFFKYRVLTRYSARQPAFDEPMDGVVYGAAASLGFAALENLEYVTVGGWEVAITRAITAVPIHGCLGAIMGYYVGQARFTPGWPLSPRHGYWIAVLLHGLYDFPLLALENAEQIAKSRAEGSGSSDNSATSDMWTAAALGAVFLVQLFAIVWTVRIVRRLHREQLAVARALRRDDDFA